HASRSFVPHSSSATRSMAGDSGCLARQLIANWSSRRMMKSKILVVDDEPDALQLVEFNLKAAGYEVVTATDGAEALQAARTVAPTLIVLDLMLPEADGLEVRTILGRDPSPSAIPNKMLTGTAGEGSPLLG